MTGLDSTDLMVTALHNTGEELQFEIQISSPLPKSSYGLEIFRFKINMQPKIRLILGQT